MVPLVSKPHGVVMPQCLKGMGNDCRAVVGHAGAAPASAEMVGRVGGGRGGGDLQRVSRQRHLPRLRNPPGCSSRCQGVWVQKHIPALSVSLFWAAGIPRQCGAGSSCRVEGVCQKNAFMRVLSKAVEIAPVLWYQPHHLYERSATLQRPRNGSVSHNSGWLFPSTSDATVSALCSALQSLLRLWAPVAHPGLRRWAVPTAFSGDRSLICVFLPLVTAPNGNAHCRQ